MGGFRRNQLHPQGGIRLRLKFSWRQSFFSEVKVVPIYLAGDPNFDYGAHRQIWNGANGTDPVPLENKLVSASYGRSVSNTSVAKVDDEIYDAATSRRIRASDLWDLGSGYVRVMEELSL